MRLIIIRTLIVMWLVAVPATIGAIVTHPMETPAMFAFGVLPLWAIQFIPTGIVNPTRLISAAGFRQK